MLAHAWQDFAGASMALAGPFDLCVREDGGAFQWWVSGILGSYRLRQGRAGTLAEAKAAAEAAHVDYVARPPRPSLTPSEAGALLAAQASDLPPPLSPSETSR